VESLRGYNDDEDQRRAVLWPGFRIVGAKEMVEEGEDKEPAVTERTSLQTTRRDGPRAACEDQFSILHIFIYLFLVSNISYLQNIVQTKLAKFISLRTLS
jgi:hypothetical protein